MTSGEQVGVGHDNSVLARFSCLERPENSATNCGDWTLARKIRGGCDFGQKQEPPRGTSVVATSTYTTTEAPA